jgi:biopolymer transport protein ExbB
MVTKTMLAMSLVGTEWVLYVLILLSVLSIAIIIERVFVLNRKKGDIEKLQEDLGPAFKRADPSKVEHILGEDPSSPARVAVSVLQMMKTVNLGFEESIAMALSQEKLDLERRFAILGTLGSNAPYLGLFGTVLGIIKAFHNLSMNAKGGASVVMAGISEALIATALGLMIAIPAVMAYNYFSRYVKKIIVSSENFTRIVIAGCRLGEKEK